MESAKPCSFFEKGNCKFGKKCKFSHSRSQSRSYNDRHQHKKRRHEPSSFDPDLDHQSSRPKFVQSDSSASGLAIHKMHTTTTTTMVDQTAAFASPHIAEIKKVFTACDRDHNGSINRDELKILVKNLSGTEPSGQEMQSLMLKMDADGDGEITWEEFYPALSSWLAEAEQSFSDKDEGASSPLKARAKTHHAMKSFFLQFKRVSCFADMRQRIFASGSKSKSSNKAGQDFQIHTDEHSNHSNLKYSVEQKIDKMKTSLQTCQKIGAIAQTLLQNPKLTTALQCSKQIADILSVVEVLQTAEERFMLGNYTVGDYLCQIFERVIEASVIPVVVSRFLSHSPMSLPAGSDRAAYIKLQLQVVRIITFFAPGPRIAHTPAAYKWHPSNLLSKKVLIFSSNALRGLSNVLDFYAKDLTTQDQAIWLKRDSKSVNLQMVCKCVEAIGYLVAHDASVLETVFRNESNLGLYTKLVALLDIGVKLAHEELLIRVTWAISIFCGHTHTIKGRPFSDENYYKFVGGTRAAFLKIGRLFMDTTNHQIMVHLVSSLKYLLFSVDPGKALEKLIAIVKFQGRSKFPIKQCALECLTILCKKQPNLAKACVEHGIFPALVQILRLNSVEGQVAVPHMACLKILLQLVETKEHVPLALHAQVGHVVIMLIKEGDPSAHVIGIKLLKRVCRAGFSECDVMVRNVHLLKALSSTISTFKRYDDVMGHWGYMEPVLDFDKAHQIVSILSELHLIGSQQQRTNPWVDFFDLELVDKLENILRICQEEDDIFVDNWRHGESDGNSLEQRIARLLTGIREQHLKQLGQDGQSGLLSRRIGVKIEKVLRQYQQQIKRSAKETVAFRAKRHREQTLSGGKVSMVDAAGGNPDHWIKNPTIWSNMTVSGGSDAPIEIKTVIKKGEARVLPPVPRGITFGVLHMLIQRQYNQGPLDIKYRDSDNDLITIDSQAQLESALRLMESYSQGKYRFLVFHKNKRGRGQFADTEMSSNFRYEFLPSQAPSLQRSEKNSSGLGLSIDNSTLRNMLGNEFERLSLQFRHLANKRGNVNRSQFAKALADHGVRDKTRVQQYWNAMDTNKDNSIDWREFMTGLAILHNGTAREKLKLMFKAYDSDNNGYIDKKELAQMFKIVYKSEGKARSSEDIWSMVERCFARYDADNKY